MVNFVHDYVNKAFLESKATENQLYEIIYINHYITKSKQDWREKIKRHRADIPHGVYVRNMTQFEDLNQLSTIDCGFLEMPHKRVGTDLWSKAVKVSDFEYF